MHDDDIPMKSVSGRGFRRGVSKSGCLIVLAIGVVLFLLAGMCDFGMPFGGKKWAYKSAASCAAQLAKCYHCYCFTDPEARVITTKAAGGTVNGFALVLAAHGGMNMADLWFIKRDQALENVNTWPLQVADIADPKHPVIEPLFVVAKPKSWAVVVDMPDPKTLESRASTYPVIWTRGLGPAGWKKDSPYQGEGGHVAYLDGHVVWYDKTTDDNGAGVFKDYRTGEPTSDIRQAIGPGAKVLEDE